MLESKYIYAGPSWAASSFPQGLDATNLSKEWQIPCISVAECGSTVLGQLERVGKILDQKKMPVIWVYNEPISDINQMLGIDLEEFVQQEDWKTLRDRCNQICLNRIDELGVPVLMIGAHSDITGNVGPNITIGCDSWQKWLAKRAGMLVNDNIIKVDPADGGNFDLSHCWGAEIIHRFLHENTTITPARSLVDAIWDVYYFWQELQARDWFYEVHPNKRGNIEFAEFLKPTVDNFLGEYLNG